MPTRVVYVNGMGGSPEDWRPLQSRQAGMALALDTGAATPEECATALAEKTVSLGGPSFALCGYSMGGRIALLAAKQLLARKKKPDGVILVSAGFGFASEEEREKRNAADEEWAKLAESSTEEFWNKWYAQDLFASFHSLTEAAREAWLEDRRKLEKSELAAQLRHLGPGRHGDLLPVLNELTKAGVRVLYVAGELDKKYSAVADSLQGKPGVLVEKIAGAGHLLPLEAPDALAVRVAKFVR